GRPVLSSTLHCPWSSLLTRQRPGLTFLLILRRPPRSSPFSYTTLFRSQYHQLYRLSRNCSKYRQQLYQYHEKYQPHQKQHRSEERRVGKECRSRWAPDHEEEKTKKKSQKVDERTRGRKQKQRRK